MNPSGGPTQATEKSLEAMRVFSQTYAKRTGTYFCSDLGTTAVVIEGLAAPPRTNTDLPSAPVASMKIKKQRWLLPIGIALVCPCENAKSAIACCFSPQIMPLLETQQDNFS